MAGSFRAALEAHGVKDMTVEAAEEGGCGEVGVFSCGF